MIELPFKISEQVMVMEGDPADPESVGHFGFVVENADANTAEVEVHVDGEEEPRLISVAYIIRHTSRYPSQPEDD